RSKAPKLGDELGLGIDVVKALRGVCDPAGVLNRGNLLPSVASKSPRLARPAPQRAQVDAQSLLVEARGAARLGEIEGDLDKVGLSLQLGAQAPMDATVDAWIAEGAPGGPDPWLDPVDHLVAGFSATLRSGAVLETRPAPRRAVGPDLFSLFLGA